jgi:hypothetical protein
MITRAFQRLQRALGVGKERFFVGESFPGYQSIFLTLSVYRLTLYLFTGNDLAGNRYNVSLGQIVPVTLEY